MAMFGKNGKATAKEIEEASKSSNIITKGTTITGNIESLGIIRIDGNLIGDIRSRVKVVVGAAACIEGNIYAQHAEIEGEIKGTLEVAEVLVLKATAKIWGDIITGKLIVESGATFEGKCRMKNSDNTAQANDEDTKEARSRQAEPVS
jgi:cytoskeletal protein CcmA (bactofilin family)